MVFLSPGTVPLSLPPMRRRTEKCNLRMPRVSAKPPGKAEDEGSTALRSEIVLPPPSGKRLDPGTGAVPETRIPAGCAGREG